MTSAFHFYVHFKGILYDYLNEVILNLPNIKVFFVAENKMFALDIKHKSNSQPDYMIHGNPLWIYSNELFDFPYGAFSSPRSYTSWPPLIAASPFREAEDKASEITAEYLGNDSWIPEKCLWNHWKLCCKLVQDQMNRLRKSLWWKWLQIHEKPDTCYSYI